MTGHDILHILINSTLTLCKSYRTSIRCIAYLRQFVASSISRPIMTTMTRRGTVRRRRRRKSRLFEVRPFFFTAYKDP